MDQIVPGVKTKKGLEFVLWAVMIQFEGSWQSIIQEVFRASVEAAFAVSLFPSLSVPNKE